jgi:UDP-N-acetylglucosamine transferase subunit ALG13
LIFLTVGSQMPFDRLVVAVDDWGRSHPETEVMAQIGSTPYKPLHLRSVEALSPAKFNDYCQSAQLIVAHAGMGSILTALRYGKPIVVMPRKGALKETRNDHQVAAGDWLKSLQGVFFAEDEIALPVAIDAAMAQSLAPEPIANQASQVLIQGLRRFIDAT